MDKKDLENMRARTEILLKPIWDYLQKPQSPTITENALNGGIRIVDRRGLPSVHTTLMQAVHSGHIHRAGTLTLNTERHIYHLPDYHLSASVAVGILKMEFEGRTLDTQDSAKKAMLIEQPVPSYSEQEMLLNETLPYESPNEPFFLKPSIESLLLEGKPVPEIAQLLAGQITMLRPVLSSINIKLPDELEKAVRAQKISVASILVQNHVDVFSTLARSKEADELVSIATGRSTSNAGAERLREILRLDI